jgi:trans-aconitate methyltransferase
MGTDVSGAEHWNQAYQHGDTTRSWYQRRPTTSLRMLERCGLDPGTSLIDVGGGAATLVDALLELGHRDLTVLDISPDALAIARRRLGPSAERVEWIVADLLTWQPARTWQVWHDRAVLHFLTPDQARHRYLPALHAATRAGDATAIFATFAPDGPQTCSGLPVTRYGVGDLTDLLGSSWELVADERAEHTTPSGGIQPFTWAAFRRLA